MMQKIAIFWGTWKFVNIDVIFLNKIIKFVTHHLHVWSALCMNKFNAFALHSSFPYW